MLKHLPRRLGVPLAAALLAGCAGNGQGLDSNGQPIGPGSAPDKPLTAEFQSIQDNIFTPKCVRCHSGGGRSSVVRRRRRAGGGAAFVASPGR